MNHIERGQRRELNDGHGVNREMLLRRGGPTERQRDPCDRRIYRHTKPTRWNISWPPIPTFI